MVLIVRLTHCNAKTPDSIKIFRLRFPPKWPCRPCQCFPERSFVKDHNTNCRVQPHKDDYTGEQNKKVIQHKIPLVGCVYLGRVPVRIFPSGTHYNEICSLVNDSFSGLFVSFGCGHIVVIGQYSIILPQHHFESSNSFLNSIPSRTPGRLAVKSMPSNALITSLRYCSPNAMFAQATTLVGLNPSR